MEVVTQFVRRMFLFLIRGREFNIQADRKIKAPHSIITWFEFETIQSAKTQCMHRFLIEIMLDFSRVWFSFPLDKYFA